ncbi:hypothetical protein Fmac_025796 [Flemingia macrophylla]|uniref:NAD(P)-binding domain-containing protein n=1 Tax=Flemingia macrophylla TaxID=520843 RepID=A0ABD1LD12_9FABA
MPSLEDELFPSTPGKFKMERSNHGMNRQLYWCFASASTMFLWALFLIALTASYLSFQAFLDSGSKYLSASWGDIQWEKQVRTFAQIHRQGGISVLVTGAAGFVGSHVSLALKRRGNGVLGLDNFNDYYDPSLKKAQKSLLSMHDVFVVEGDVNDAKLLAKLFDMVAFTHVMHLAAQARVRYAMENPHSYVHSNITIANGLSFFTFLNCWAGIARNKQHVPNPQFISAKLFPPKNVSGFDPRSGITKENIVCKMFVFDACAVENLRERYASSENDRPTRVNAFPLSFGIIMWL